MEVPETQKAAVGAILETTGTKPEADRHLQPKVCHLIGSLQYGGAERQVVNVLNHLPLAERFVLLLNVPHGDDLTPALNDEVVCGVVPVRLRRLPRDLVKVARWLRQWRIDVLHTHMFWPNLIGAVAGRMAGVPVVITSEHGLNPWKRHWHRWVERRLITPLVDLRICASEDIRETRRWEDGLPAHKLLCMSNGTELPTAIARGGGDPPVVGSVGRFVPAKDYLGLIDAAALLRDRGVIFRLCLVGDGPEREAIERAIARHRLDRIVELPGIQADPAAWMNRFDVFVLPSVREGQPLALLEAMAHGLPIVATRTGGIPNTVNAAAEEAVLIEPGDVGALADALCGLLADPKRRRLLGANARRRAERDFSIQSVTARYVKIYRGLWDGSGSVHT